MDVDVIAGRVTLAGALTGGDCHHLDDAWQTLRGGAQATWLLDLTHVTCCDTAGVRALQRAARAAAAAGSALVIAAPNTRLRHLLVVARLSDLLTPASTQPEQEPSSAPAPTGCAEPAGRLPDRPATPTRSGSALGAVARRSATTSRFADNPGAEAPEHAENDDRRSEQPAPPLPGDPVPAGTGHGGGSVRTGGRMSSRTVFPVLDDSRRRTPHLQRSSPEPIALTAVGQQLLNHGCTAELADVGVGGELDIRLLVRRDSSLVSVEVLGPCDGAGQRDRWHAVRVDSDGYACVWSGPALPCPTEALVAFVENLLGEDLHPLTGPSIAVG